jgi:hypothetical protein
MSKVDVLNILTTAEGSHEHIICPNLRFVEHHKKLNSTPPEGRGVDHMFCFVDTS